MYHISKEQSYLTRALESKNQIMAVAQDYPNNVTIVRFSKLATAFIFKLGGIRKKAKAIDLFEELLVVFPSNLEIKMNLVELYFEDLSTDLIGNTQDRIDALLEEVAQNPLMRNPTTINEYSRYQILVAKYIYYVNGDIPKALDLLYELQAQAEKYSLKRVLEQITREIQILESEVTKWTNIQLSTQDRMKASKINTYLREALNIVKRDSV